MESTGNGDRGNPVTFISCRTEGKVTKHVFEGVFDENGPHEVWKCMSCGDRRVWGASRVGPKTRAVRNWRWTHPEPPGLSAGQVNR